MPVDQNSHWQNFIKVTITLVEEHKFMFRKTNEIHCAENIVITFSRFQYIKYSILVAYYNLKLLLRDCLKLDVMLIYFHNTLLLLYILIETTHIHYYIIFIYIINFKSLHHEEF